jgi:hypothetical protein
VIDQQAPVALQAAEGLLDLPPARLDREARLVLAPDQLQGNAVGSSPGFVDYAARRKRRRRRSSLARPYMLRFRSLRRLI